MDEHDKDYEMKNMDSMSTSKRWKEYGSMQDNVWIMHKEHGK